MERVIDELEMISTPLAESEDSLMSDMSVKNDIARSSWLELRGVRRRLEDGNESDYDEEDDRGEVYGPPPVPERDYSRLRPYVYRKRADEFPMRRSKSYERPVRPRTPERKWARNAKNLTENSKIINPVYATPIRKKVKLITSVEPPIIEEFAEEVPKYVRAEEQVIEKKEKKDGEQLENDKVLPVPLIDLSTEVEFSSSKKVEKSLAREDSLTSLLKRQLSSKKEQVLPEYVEPKDPIIKELQEFLKIEPKSSDEPSVSNSANSSSNKETLEEVTGKEKVVQADEHRLIVRGWQELLKSSSSSSAASTSSTTV
uniref:Uncharacterized protein n=2 Tax=Caenorhabditis japonica TaxID=281687 RepID=A0A8R1EA47_CAEJA